MRAGAPPCGTCSKVLFTRVFLLTHLMVTLFHHHLASKVKQSTLIPQVVQSGFSTGYTQLLNVLLQPPRRLPAPKALHRGFQGDARFAKVHAVACVHPIPANSSCHDLSPLRNGVIPFLLPTVH